MPKRKSKPVNYGVKQLEAKISKLEKKVYSMSVKDPDFEKLYGELNSLKWTLQARKDREAGKYKTDLGIAEHYVSLEERKNRNI